MLKNKDELVGKFKYSSNGENIAMAKVLSRARAILEWLNTFGQK